MKKQFEIDHAFSDKMKGLFWKLVLEDMNEKQRKLLLKFISGSSSLIPDQQYSIEKFEIIDDEDDVKRDVDKQLPHATTCGFQMYIPNYSTYEIMKERILYAI